MIYYYPDYYDSFQCIGGKCPDTCCAGWNIDIDRRSLEYYDSVIRNSDCTEGRNPRSERESFCRKLGRSIDFKNQTFRLNRRRCALLTEDNLCDLYIHLGEQALCNTCRTYPRHQEEFGSVREISLSMSCPESARIILSRPARPEVCERITASSCPADQETDQKLLRWLLESGKLLLDIIWSPIPLNLAVSMALAFSHDLHRRHGQGCFFKDGEFQAEAAERDLHQLARKYLENGTVTQEHVKSFIDQKAKRLSAGRCRQSLSWYRDMVKLHIKLDPVVDNWKEMVNSCVRQVSLDQDLSAFSFTQNSLWERQLLTYYIQVYFPGAIYDDDIYGKMQFAATSWLMTCLLSRTLTPSHQLSATPGTYVLRAAYLYSRQVENWDDNLNRVLEFCEKPGFLSLLELLA